MNIVDDGSIHDFLGIIIGKMKFNIIQRSILRFGQNDEHQLNQSNTENGTVE